EAECRRVQEPKKDRVAVRPAVFFMGTVDGFPAALPAATRATARANGRSVAAVRATAVRDAAARTIAAMVVVMVSIARPTAAVMGTIGAMVMTVTPAVPPMPSVSAV